MSKGTKKWLPIILSFGLALMLSYFLPSIEFGYKEINVQAQINKETSVLSQDVVDVSATTHTITRIYNGSQLIGVLTDQDKIDDFLTTVYQERYASDFPNTNIALGTDIYMTKESSYFIYDDIDDEILDYINQNDLFSLEVIRIDFSNGAVVYVKNQSDFDEAKRQYLLNFIDEDALNLIAVNQLPPELTTYGERDIGIQVVETISISKGYASIKDIKTSVKDIIYFLSYGYGTDIQTYTTVEYDTVEGVASKVGLSTQQLITLNSDILKTSTQLLQVGTVLNVTFFNSPINVIVTKERVAKEVVYPDSTIYKANSSLREGVYNTLVDEEDGSKNVFYEEVYVNGEISTYEVLSEEVTLQPIQQVVEYGTKIVPGVGTGTFRYPVDNVKITCHWYCYAGHRGLDVINMYDRYGSVKAADRGTIMKVGYNSINGYYVWIDHNNGYTTYYGHMSRPCYFSVGVNVDKGEVIGQIGMTGQATGPHVHFVIEYYDNRSDPCNWLGC